MSKERSMFELSDIDQIIARFGNYGLFQKRFIGLFNFLFIIFFAMAYMNKVISLNVPDHWCHVPGREETNYTVEEWRHLTIPREIGSNGFQSYSKCTRFGKGIKEDEFITNMTIKCDQGWEYDHTWYNLTTSMEHNWVCDDSLFATNAIAMLRAGEMIATLLTGHLADNYGRLSVFYLTVSCVLFARLISIYTSSWIYIFMFLNLLSSQIEAGIQSCLVIGAELFREDTRGMLGFIFCLSWSIGMSITPLFMWWLRDWKIFSLITTLPCGLFLFSRPFITESPRWLITQGKIQRCIAELDKIGKTNQIQTPENIETQLKHLQINGGVPKKATIIQLFSSIRLAKNTLILAFSMCNLGFMYTCFIVNVGNFGGNPFLNYFFQSLFEFPGQLIGKYITDHFGRRWATSIGFLNVSFLSLIMAFVIQTNPSVIVIIVMCIIIKVNLAMSFLSTNLQMLEIYPTCVRQTGSLFVLFCSNLASIFSPYLVALGVTVNVSIPYYIFAILSIIAAISSFFLPETLGQKLPESLKDGSSFGAHQNYWGQNIFKETKELHETEIPLQTYNK